MSNYIKYIIAITALIFLIGCGKKDDPNTNNKSNIQYLADKEKELNDREAKIKLKEVELDEREKKISGYENKPTGDSTKTTVQKDTSKLGDKEKKLEKEKQKQEKKKEIQQEISKKFENPQATVKDYYEYIQRAINEKGNFDTNMKKAQKYFPSRSSEKLKGGYRNTKAFTVVEEPKVVTQKDNTAQVVSKVQQTQTVKKDGKDTDVTKTMTVTYNLSANKNGVWVITGNSVKEDQ